MRGRFLVIEGPDGAGKTTQTRLLAARLRHAGIPLITPREPGGTPAGEAIRELLLREKNRALNARAELFLFQAARAQLIEDVLRPALSKGHWVLCDRFTLSTQVYQGRAGGVPEAGIRAASTLATDGLRPDLYLVLWAPAKLCLARCQARSGTSDRMESKGRVFLERVSRAYKQIAQHNPAYSWVDARAETAEVTAEIARRVARLLPSAQRKKFLEPGVPA